MSWHEFWDTYYATAPAWIPWLMFVTIIAMAVWYEIIHAHEPSRMEVELSYFYHVRNVVLGSLRRNVPNCNMAELERQAIFEPPNENYEQICNRVCLEEAHRMTLYVVGGYRFLSEWLDMPEGLGNAFYFSFFTTVNTRVCDIVLGKLKAESDLVTPSLVRAAVEAMAARQAADRNWCRAAVVRKKV